MNDQEKLDQLVIDAYILFHTMQDVPPEDADKLKASYEKKLEEIEKLEDKIQSSPRAEAKACSKSDVRAAWEKEHGGSVLEVTDDAVIAKDDDGLMSYPWSEDDEGEPVFGEPQAMDEDEAKSYSLSEYEEKVRSAWEAEFRPRRYDDEGILVPSPVDIWIHDILNDAVIARRMEDGQLLRYPYAEGQDGFSFGEPIPVTKQYEPEKETPGSDGAAVVLIPDPTVAEMLVIPGGLPSETLHVTIAYLGEVDELDRARVLSAVRDTARGLMTAVPVMLNGIGRFRGTDEAGDPVYVNADSPDIEGLRRAFSTLNVSEHGYTPHLTLAYVPSGAPMPDAPDLPTEPVVMQLALMWANEIVPIDTGATKAGKRIAQSKVEDLVSLRKMAQSSLEEIIAKLDAVLAWARYSEGQPQIQAGSAMTMQKAFSFPYLKAVALPGGDRKGAVIGGYMALWGDPDHRDLHGDYFTPKTEFYLDAYSKAPALFHHGKDPKLGVATLGHRDDAWQDEVGLWVQDWIDVSSDYWDMIDGLLAQKALYYSPGSVPHLVKRTPDREILSFPVADDTFTPIPIQYALRDRPLDYVKAAYDAAGLRYVEPTLEERLETGLKGRDEISEAKAILELYEYELSTL